MRLGLMTKWQDIFPWLAHLAGSDIVAENVAEDHAPFTLLANTIFIWAKPVVSIAVFRPISDTHFNLPVTRSLVLCKEISVRDTNLYAPEQIIGGIIGVFTVAYFMFGNNLLETSPKVRSRPEQWGG